MRIFPCRKQISSDTWIEVNRYRIWWRNYCLILGSVSFEYLHIEFWLNLLNLHGSWSTFQHHDFLFSMLCPGFDNLNGLPVTRERRRTKFIEILPGFVFWISSVGGSGGVSFFAGSRAGIWLSINRLCPRRRWLISAVSALKAISSFQLSCRRLTRSESCFHGGSLGSSLRISCDTRNVARNFKVSDVVEFSCSFINRGRTSKKNCDAGAASWYLYKEVSQCVRLWQWYLYFRPNSVRIDHMGLPSFE